MLINAVSTEDGFVFVGWSIPGDEVSTRDVFVMRTDTTLKATWVRLCGGKADEAAHAVAVLPNGHIVVGAGTRSARRNNPEEDSSSIALGHDPWMFDLTADGYVIAGAVVPSADDSGYINGIWSGATDRSLLASTSRGMLLSVTLQPGPSLSPVDWESLHGWTSGQFHELIDNGPESQIGLTCIDPIAAGSDVVGFGGTGPSIDLVPLLRDHRWDQSQSTTAVPPG